MPQLRIPGEPSSTGRLAGWGQACLAALKRGQRWAGLSRVRRAITIILSAVALFGLAAVVYDNWDMLRTFDWQIRYKPLLLTYPLYSLALALAILGWGWILRALGSTVSWGEHVRVYCVSNLARRLPGVLWYVVGRVVLYDPEKTSKGAISFGSALELILTALAGLLVSALAWPDALGSVIHPVWILAAVGCCLVMLHPRVLEFVWQRLGRGSPHGGVQKPGYGQMLGWLLLYAAVWVAGGVVLFELIATLYPAPSSWLLSAIGAWSLSGMVAVLAAVLPVGFGLRELTLGLLLADFMPDGLAIVVAILTRLLLTAYELFWVLLIHARERISPLILK